jgi:hypothetical protein
MTQGKKEPADVRFWAKVKVIEDDDSCWEWQASTYPNGYGIFNEGESILGAHIFSYKIHKGLVPSGMLVCHTCDNKLCVRPKHLFLGTHQQNTDDMVRKGRQKNPRGEQVGQAKLTAEIVRKIRSSNDGPNVEAKKWGITRGQVYRIRSRKQWKHI